MLFVYLVGGWVAVALVLAVAIGRFCALSTKPLPAATTTASTAPAPQGRGEQPDLVGSA